MSGRYSLAKLCTLKSLFYSSILSSYQGLPRIKIRKELERTTDPTFTTKVDLVVAQVLLQTNAGTICGSKTEERHYSTTTRPISIPKQRRFRQGPVILQSSRRAQHTRTDTLRTIQSRTPVEKHSPSRTTNHQRTNRYQGKLPNNA